jgi:hypothetical protein
VVERLGEVHSGLHAGGFGEIGDLARGFGDNGVGVDIALFQHGADDALLFLGQGDEEVEREHDLASVLFGDGLGLLECFLGFLSQFVETEHLILNIWRLKRCWRIQPHLF